MRMMPCVLAGALTLVLAAPAHAQLFDKSNIPASNDFEILWPGLADYQTAFKAKWTATQ